MGKMKLIRMFLIFLLAMLLSFGSLAESIVPGATGDDVVRLQQRLSELGFYTKSIDGDYGNGTKTAVSAFQTRNGLEDTGIADEATLSLLYSDDAKAVPKKPDLLITKVSFGDTTKVTIQNNLDVAIDEIYLAICIYDARGNAYDTTGTYISGIAQMAGCYQFVEKINPGKSTTLRLATDQYRDATSKSCAVYVIDYHTADGLNYSFTADQLYRVHSDGSIEFPTNETAPDVLTDAELAQAKTISLGITTSRIYPWTSEFYLMPAGSLIYSIILGGTFDLAGVQAGDVIIELGGMDATSLQVFDHAKLKMLDGETVSMRVRRGNQEFTTEIALDMSALSDSTDDSASLTDQLTELAGLYRDGLLTEEEYNQAKQKLISGQE